MRAASDRGYTVHMYMAPCGDMHLTHSTKCAHGVPRH